MKRKGEQKMYFNDVHILVYVLVGMIGLGIGQFVHWMNKRLIDEKKVFSMEIFSKEESRIKSNYILMLITGVLYIGILYKYGIKTGFFQNLDLIKAFILTPMLLSVFVIDYQKQIIPNRLNLTLFEIGLVFTFIYGFTNYNLAINMLLGALVGGGIFLLITLIGGLIAGKEAMGFGDVKLMGALGLYFGAMNIGIVAILSFLIGAILSILLIAFKIKKTSDYIPFGPFIVIAAFIMIFVPFGNIISILFTIFTLGLNRA